MAETFEEFAARRGYESLKLMFPSRPYISTVYPIFVVVAAWSPVAQAYDLHKFPQGYEPEREG